MYEYRVREARDHINKLPFDPTEIEQLVTQLQNESPTAQVLIFYSYLDDRIQSLLALQMRHLDSQTAIERVFGLNGPLSTFSGRILIAYHLGWINEKQRTKLDAFRKLRNVFAHRAFKVAINDAEITSYIATLDYGPSGVFDDIKVAVPRLNFAPNLLCNLIVLALRTFEQLLVFPIALSHDVHPGSVFETDNEASLPTRVQHALVKSLLIAGAQDGAPSA